MLDERGSDNPGRNNLESLEGDAQTRQSLDRRPNAETVDPIKPQVSVDSEQLVRADQAAERANQAEQPPSTPEQSFSPEERALLQIKGELEAEADRLIVDYRRLNGEYRQHEQRIQGYKDQLRDLRRQRLDSGAKIDNLWFFEIGKRRELEQSRDEIESDVLLTEAGRKVESRATYDLRPEVLRIRVELDGLYRQIDGIKALVRQLRSSRNEPASITE